MQPVSRPRSSGPARAIVANPRWNVAALWGRALLTTALGVAMIQWPYPHACGWALLGYLGAVVAVLLAGAWVAFASWRLRNGLTHLLSLVLFFWGLVLAAEQVLPRIGYAPDPAAWLCGWGSRSHSTQSAMKMLVSPGLAALRLEAKTSRFPSGLNMGKASNSGLVVTRSSPLPSRFTR